MHENRFYSNPTPGRHSRALKYATMKLEDITIGQWYGYAGDNVKATEILDNGNVVVESVPYGEEEVNPSNLTNPYPVEY
jgi:hypothetical protein